LNSLDGNLVKMIRIELKYESNDLLLVRVWNSDRAYPFEPYIVGVSYL
jgi:hypothetical protein